MLKVRLKTPERKKQPEKELQKAKQVPGKPAQRDYMINTSISGSKKHLTATENCIIKQTDPSLHIYTNRTHNHPPDSFMLTAECSQREIYLASLCLHSEADAAIISIRHFSGPLNLITY